jgi:hypothetical protein
LAWAARPARVELGCAFRRARATSPNGRTRVHKFGSNAGARPRRNPPAARPRLEEAPGWTPRRDGRYAPPRLGPWTAAQVGSALGDADAVPVGDYHLPNTVDWVLAGEPRGTDDRMLELLEPFAGHRGRAARLLTLSGVHAPRFGPRAQLRSIRSL